MKWSYNILSVSHNEVNHDISFYANFSAHTKKKKNFNVITNQALENKTCNDYTSWDDNLDNKNSTRLQN